MSSLPKYYFQDLPAEVADEIMWGMRDVLPEAPFAEMDASIEEIDHWLNCNNTAATIPQWYECVEAFKITR